MPRHVDLTANVQRTAEEKLRIFYSLDQINAVIDGYPELDNRLYIPEDEQIPSRRSVVLGREVNIFTLPPGHDATHSRYRKNTLTNKKLVNDFLFGPADPDLPTGGDWQLPEDHPAVVRALRDNCRDFTQHYQPLVPGWRELVALRTPEGHGLGMPTNIGWYTHLWLSKMCDGVTLRLSPDHDDIEALLYRRGADNQSEWVWATPGGFVVKSDTLRPGMTPLQAASARRTAYWAERHVTMYPGIPLHVKYPISSGNTLVAGLATTPFARFITQPDYIAEPSVTPKTEGSERTRRDAGYVSLRQLCDYNPTGGVSGAHHGDNLFPIWTTHFEYLTAGLDAIDDAENQYRFEMEDDRLAQVQEVVDNLRACYPALQPV